MTLNTDRSSVLFRGEFLEPVVEFYYQNRNIIKIAQMYKLKESSNSLIMAIDEVIY